MAEDRGRAWRRFQARKHGSPGKPKTSPRSHKIEKNRKLLYFRKEKLMYSLRTGAQMRPRDWDYFIDGKMR